ncbi:MAG: CoA-binding protein, partial [Hyphomicrobiales bacterium]
MNPARRQNLLRLLKPRHVALIGGRDAITVAGELARIGYPGPVWPVNPSRTEIGGHACFARIEDLPEPPDAGFLAIPREAAIEAIANLSRIGAGGVVCYTAGFGETGAKGAAAEARLIAAAGDLAVVGPNCYGVLNYTDHVALWPFAHGGNSGPQGAAIITQSGMLSSDLTMSQRSVPFAYMISAGNQSVLTLENFTDVLAEQAEVRAIGLHIEGLKDIPAFERAALKALERGVPIVALKTGTSVIGSRLTVSHTGSLSGTDDLYQALFDRLGIIRVTNPAQLLETLKFICIAGIPKGNRLAGFTCSGGGATMLADHAEAIGLEFPPPTGATATELRRLLPSTATVSNPLDYTTPIWGVSERTGPVFAAALGDGYDAALIVQDYPLAGLDESKPYYLRDAASFIAAASAASIPAAICSTLPENLDRETRDMLTSNGVAPMQGIHEAMNAIAGAAWHGRRRQQILAEGCAPLVAAPASHTARTLDEAAGKAHLRVAGLPVPPGVVTTGAKAPEAAAHLGFPVALKMISPYLPHKTEAGAVKLNLCDSGEVQAAVTQMRADVTAYDPSAATDQFLIERMGAPPVAELMVSVRTDPQFGLAMTIASGGILVELI